MKLLRPVEARRRLGLGKSQFNENVRTGAFPFRAVKISEGGRAVGYVEEELDAYIAQRIATRDADLGEAD